MKAIPAFIDRNHEVKMRDIKVMLIVGAAHAMSHFCQFILPRLSDWVTKGVGISVTQLSIVIAVFYVVSCIVQASSGFLVDKKGGRPVLFLGLTFIVMGLTGYAISVNYWMLLASAVILGAGNGVFHPADYTLFNGLVTPKRISYAYSVHGLTGNLGWAIAPVFVVGIASSTGGNWRLAMACSALLVAVVLVVALSQRKLLDKQYDQEELFETQKKTQQVPVSNVPEPSPFAFLKLPVIWLCMLFFFFYAVSNGAILLYSPQAVQGLYGMNAVSSAACVTVFMVASAFGMAYGGYLAVDPSRCEKIVAGTFGVSAILALMMAFLPLAVWMVPVLFALMGFFSGIAGPSRDLIVKRATPAGASGRVFGVVYAGLDIGQSVAPLLYGYLINQKQYAGLFITLAIVQIILISSAFTAGKEGRKKTKMHDHHNR